MDNRPFISAVDWHSIWSSSATWIWIVYWLDYPISITPYAAENHRSSIEWTIQLIWINCLSVESKPFRHFITSSSFSNSNSRTSFLSAILYDLISLFMAAFYCSPFVPVRFSLFLGRIYPFNMFLLTATPHTGLLRPVQHFNDIDVWIYGHLNRLNIFMIMLLIEMHQYLLYWINLHPKDDGYRGVPDKNTRISSRVLAFYWNDFAWKWLWSDILPDFNSRLTKYYNLYS